MTGGRHSAVAGRVSGYVGAPRGVRHRVAVILGMAVCAVLAGARSFVAIAEWAADADQATLDGLGVTGAVPSESTFRRVLQSLDADALDDAAGAWALLAAHHPCAGRPPLVAVDGKTLRGSGTAGEPRRHLLASLDHARGVVLEQVDVQAKTNEIPLLATLLDRIDLAGAMVTAVASAVTAAQSQRPHRHPGPAPREPRPGTAARPRPDPADHPRDKRLLAAVLQPAHLRRTRRTLAQLGTPPPGPITLVPPARTTKPGLCPGQLAIGGSHTTSKAPGPCAES